MADMEYCNIVAYTGCLTFMWSGKFNNNCLESQGKSGNFYYLTEWEPCERAMYRLCEDCIIFNN